MPQTVVEIQTIGENSLAVGSSGPRTVTIDRSKEAGGQGLGFNGGELLLLAIGGCYSNDLFREAAKLGIKITSAKVQVRAEWGGNPVRAQNVSFSVAVGAEASDERIRELVHHTDRIAEIPNSLRLGTAVKLAEVLVIPDAKTI